MSCARTMLRLGSLGIALAFLTVGPLLAQEKCNEDQDQTWADCVAEQFNKLQTFQHQAETQAAQATQTTADENQEEQTESVAEAVQQTLIGAATGSEFNLEDTLSSLLANLDIDGLENGDGSLRFKKNYQLTYGTIAVELQASEGELFPELEMKLGEAEQDDLVEELNGTLEDFDDIDVNLTFSLDRSGEDTAIWWGRRFRTPQGLRTGNAAVADRLYQQITAIEAGARGEAAGEATKEELTKAFKEFSNAVNTYLESIDEDEDEGDNQDEGEDANKDECKGEGRLKVKCTPEPWKLILNSLIPKLGEAEKADFESFKQALTDGRFFELNKLVANQPQFVLSAGRSFRDELVGRDGWTASVKYEMGQANVNGFRRACKDKNLSITCYKEFLETKDGALQKNWRAALEGSYTWTDDYSYTSPDGSVSLALDEAQAWDISFSAGRSLRLDQDGMEVTRFDLEATYEDVTGDTEKQARFISTANFTQKINDSLSLAVGVVYASRPEYRGEVDEELSARAGLKFNLKRSDD